MIDAGNSVAMTLYLLHAIAGAEVEEQALEAEEFGEQWGEQYERFREFREEYMWVAWLYGTWHAHRGDSANVRALQGILETRAAASGNTETALYAEALAADVALLNGDTTHAIERLSGLSSVGTSDSLSGAFGLSLPTERLRLAEVLCAQRRYRECLDAASVFDHQTPLVYVIFVPASLQLRLRAARALGLSDLARDYQQRLTTLGRLEMSEP